MISKDLEDSFQSFLKVIVEMQDKSYHKDPIKHKKRILSGMHEARKSITAKKAKILIIAPDLEKCPQPGTVIYFIHEKQLNILKFQVDSTQNYQN